jgi:superfamily II DNA/RNA helicase
MTLAVFQTRRCGRAARAGRSGSALCLLTREELPFLLDLHLYLGRTVSRGFEAGF